MFTKASIANNRQNVLAPSSSPLVGDTSLIALKSAGSHSPQRPHRDPRHMQAIEYWCQVKSLPVHEKFCPPYHANRRRPEMPTALSCRLGQLRQNRWRIDRAELRTIHAHQAVSVKETLRVHARIGQRAKPRAHHLLEQFRRQQLSPLRVRRIAHMDSMQSATVGSQCAAPPAADGKSIH